MDIVVPPVVENLPAGHLIKVPAVLLIVHAVRPFFDPVFAILGALGPKTGIYLFACGADFEIPVPLTDTSIIARNSRLLEIYLFLTGATLPILIEDLAPFLADLGHGFFELFSWLADIPFSVPFVVFQHPAVLLFLPSLLSGAFAIGAWGKVHPPALELLLELPDPFFELTLDFSAVLIHLTGKVFESATEFSKEIFHSFVKSDLVCQV